jgi:hypothetical protein
MVNSEAGSNRKTFIKVRVTVQPPPSVNLGDEIISEAGIDSTGDLTPINNFSQLVQTVRGSFDPNDKTESGGGILTKEEVDNGKDLIYTNSFPEHR